MSFFDASILAFLIWFVCLVLAWIAQDTVKEEA